MAVAVADLTEQLARMNIQAIKVKKGECIDHTESKPLCHITIYCTRVYDS